MSRKNKKKQVGISRKNRALLSRRGGNRTENLHSKIIDLRSQSRAVGERIENLEDNILDAKNLLDVIEGNASTPDATPEQVRSKESLAKLLEDHHPTADGTGGRYVPVPSTESLADHQILEGLENAFPGQVFPADVPGHAVRAVTETIDEFLENGMGDSLLTLGLTHNATKKASDYLTANIAEDKLDAILKNPRMEGFVTDRANNMTLAPIESEHAHYSSRPRIEKPEYQQAEQFAVKLKGGQFMQRSPMRNGQHYYSKVTVDEAGKAKPLNVGFSGIGAGQHFLDGLIQHFAVAMTTYPSMIESLSDTNPDYRVYHEGNMAPASDTSKEKIKLELTRNQALVQRHIACLLHPNTRRLIIDARQAARFIETPGGPPKEIYDQIRPPFDQFYIEFTEPLLVGEAEAWEPGQVKSASISPAADLSDMPHTRVNVVGNEFVRGVVYVPMKSAGPEALANMPPLIDPISLRCYRMDQAIQVTFFLEDEGGNKADRTFYYFPTLNAAATRINNLINGSDPSYLRIPDSIEPMFDRPAGGDLDSNYLLFCTPYHEQCTVFGGLDETGLPMHRYVGWWERTLESYASLLSWLLVYTTAKGITTVEEPLPRSIRRRADREAEKLAASGRAAPQPWRIVVVEPTTTGGASEDSFNGATGQGIRHGYRYDVMGHFRYGKSRLRDGSYRYHPVRWIAPHQRGLKNATYIPRISKFTGDIDTKHWPEIE